MGSVAAGFDLDASKALQGIGRLGDDGPGGADLLGKEPVVAVDADLALVGQLDLAQASFVVAEALAAAVGVLLALQLAVCVVALPQGVGKAAAVGFGVAQLRLGSAAQGVELVARCADELPCPAFLFIGGELAVGVVGELGGFVDLPAGKPGLLLGEVACGVPAVEDAADRTTQRVLDEIGLQRLMGLRKRLLNLKLLAGES